MTGALPESERLHAGLRRATARLLALRHPAGYWEGRLSSSALATAIASSALTLAHTAGDAALIRAGAAWLARTQLADGGWGDTPESPSNLATTLLALAALTLAAEVADTGASARAPRIFTRPRRRHARGDRARRPQLYGADRTFAVPILMNCALAGLLPWDAIPGLPFELAVFPASWYKLLRLHVVSYALPALIAIGLLLERRHPARNPLLRLARRLATQGALARLARIQPENGGFWKHCRSPVLSP